MSQNMSARDGWADQLAWGWKEFSISLGASPNGHQFAVLRLRRPSSVAVVQNIRSAGPSWTENELADVMNVFSVAVYQHLTVTRGLQLTLPLEG